jgi:hypothetical protein
MSIPPWLSRTVFIPTYYVYNIFTLHFVFYDDKWDHGSIVSMCMAPLTTLEQIDECS